MSCNRPGGSRRTAEIRVVLRRIPGGVLRLGTRTAAIHKGQRALAVSPARAPSTAASPADGGRAADGRRRGPLRRRRCPRDGLRGHCPDCRASALPDASGALRRGARPATPLGRRPPFPQGRGRKTTKRERESQKGPLCRVPTAFQVLRRGSGCRSPGRGQGRASAGRIGAECRADAAFKFAGPSPLTQGARRRQQRQAAPAAGPGQPPRRPGPRADALDALHSAGRRRPTRAFARAVASPAPDTVRGGPGRAGEYGAELCRPTTWRRAASAGC